MNIIGSSLHIKDILFRYADEISLESEGVTTPIKGFIYRKRNGYDSQFYKNGRLERDNEFRLVADNNGIKRGDKVLSGERSFVITEVSPLSGTDADAGVTAKAMLLR